MDVIARGREGVDCRHPGGPNDDDALERLVCVGAFWLLKAEADCVLCRIISFILRRRENWLVYKNQAMLICSFRKRVINWSDARTKEKRSKQSNIHPTLPLFLLLASSASTLTHAPTHTLHTALVTTAPAATARSPQSPSLSQCPAPNTRSRQQRPLAHRAPAVAPRSQRAATLLHSAVASAALTRR